MELLTTVTGAYDTSFGIVQNGTAANLMWQTLYNPFFEDCFSPTKLTAQVEYITSIPLSDEEVIDLERKNFETRKKEYVKKYDGKYLAILNGEVLDQDTDFSELSMRVYERYGYRAIFMPRVTKKEKVRKMSPKFKAAKTA